ncbi:MAG: hypothetical protein QS748_08860 [Candidatus Endonucleobacter bathymodioli]|uniref:Uncharacterized protein n=1 Tax=Candidatus Endonucleibacter bathymodioli TaxID=539814 RepID=A0AA90NRK5_9GAMM|nr:hypothetical protein [Candidatus Endonucleobacter bathymodioli]
MLDEFNTSIHQRCGTRLTKGGNLTEDEASRIGAELSKIVDVVNCIIPNDISSNSTYTCHTVSVTNMCCFMNNDLGQYDGKNTSISLYVN